MKSRLEYLERYLGAVDFVTSGRKGAISNDSWLTANYDCDFYSVIEKHLGNTDDRVRSETIMLLASLKERRAAERIREMRMTDNERVSMACLGYLSSIGEDDVLIPKLIETLEHERGTEFKKAAARIGSVGRSDDISVLRKIYGQTNGDMRAQVRDALVRIIDRDPELKKKKDLLLSVPVFPDEKGFDRFLKNGTEYLDVRYRNSVHPLIKISSETYNNIVRGIRNIRTRLYNESENLEHYQAEYTGRYNHLVDLLSWAVGDLSSKEVFSASSEKSIVCAKCGSNMILGSDEWMCIECGNRLRI
ncbi:MAG: hypothetical protein FWD37_06595 [Methanomassiliicoccaceae archaeon]|nr:hypothetical protein [Methanomassiliicoccaceae archaeon]